MGPEDSATLAVGFLLYILSMFLIGFSPGFYLSYLLFTKVKLHPLGAFLLAVIVGSFLGYFSFNTIPNFSPDNTFPPRNIYWKFFLSALPAIVVLEILIITLHYLLSRKQKKKNS